MVEDINKSKAILMAHLHVKCIAWKTPTFPESVHMMRKFGKPCKRVLEENRPKLFSADERVQMYLYLLSVYVPLTRDDVYISYLIKKGSGLHHLRYNFAKFFAEGLFQPPSF